MLDYREMHPILFNAVRGRRERKPATRLQRMIERLPHEKQPPPDLVKRLLAALTLVKSEHVSLFALHCAVAAELPNLDERLDRMRNWPAWDSIRAELDRLSELYPMGGPHSASP